MKKKPHERPTAETLLDHPFVAESIARLKSESPVGYSKHLAELVADNLEKIEAFRKKEQEKAKKKGTKGTHSSEETGGNTPLYIPSDHSSMRSSDSGNTALLVIDTNLEGTSGERNGSKHRAGTRNVGSPYGQDERTSNVIGTLAYRQFLENNASPLAGSTFFKIQKGESKADGEGPGDTPESHLLKEMRKQLIGLDEKYHNDIKDLKQRFEGFRKKLLSQEHI